MGSRAGIPNKNRDRLLRHIKEEFPDYDPIMHLCSIATNEKNDVEVRLSASKEVCQYVYPKLKAIDLSGGLEMVLLKRNVKRFDGTTA